MSDEIGAWPDLLQTMLFTEAERKRLVVRWVRSRFPGVADVGFSACDAADEVS